MHHEGAPLLRRAPLWAVLALAALLIAGCGDDEDRYGRDEAAGLVALEIRILDDSLVPSQVTLQAPDVMSVTAINDSDRDCSFSLGPYVNGLEVPAGESASIEFTVSKIEPQPERAVMGCGDGDSRSGEVEIVTITA